MWPFDNRNWELRIAEIQEGHNIFYRVKREIPVMNLTETRILNDMDKAIEQFRDWME